MWKPDSALLSRRQRNDQRDTAQGRTARCRSIEFRHPYDYIWFAGIRSCYLQRCSIIRLRRKLVGAVPLCENIYLADHIASPFVLGLFRPKIFLPSSLSEVEQEYIIQHEKHHIRRGDHVTRILAFAALCVHWFNPLVWLAFVLSGRDMEMSCDEAVMKRMDGDIRADYSASLLTSPQDANIWGHAGLWEATLAEIKNVLNYKKPASGHHLA